MANGLAPLELLARMVWLDGRPLLPMVEPYRRRLFEEFFAVDATGHPRYNLGLFGRAKKNNKTLDLIVAAFTAVTADSPQGSQVRIVANDEDQAGDDLDLAKKLVKVNPLLDATLVIKRDRIERRDDGGFIEVLPAKDAIGAHGKTFKLLCIDEVHGYRDWDLLEALAPDPTRRDAQTWITSYASIYHRPGAPLFDLLRIAKAGTDPRMLFSWYAADFSTDPDYADATPEQRANPSMGGWDNPSYLAEQQRRLPSHKYRRLHLNLPGLPDGAAYTAEAVMEAVDRGVSARPALSGVRYFAFADMSGGSSDDATLAITHVDAGGRAVLDRVINQGAPTPFDPMRAVLRFADVLREYHIRDIQLDAYGGLTFKRAFETLGLRALATKRSTSDQYEDFEPILNSGRAVLLDVSTLEQQLLGLVWRGQRITHNPGQHDDWATSAVGAILRALDPKRDAMPLATITAPSSRVNGGMSRTMAEMKARKSADLARQLHEARTRPAGDAWAPR